MKKQGIPFTLQFPLIEFRKARVSSRTYILQMQSHGPGAPMHENHFIPFESSENCHLNSEFFTGNANVICNLKVNLKVERI